MGDMNNSATRRLGVSIIRPKLHNDTQENRELFRRWTKLHMHDILSLPKDQELGGASRILRYIRQTESGGEEYLYTIHLDDVRLPGSRAFQEMPHRLDLESTRALSEGEEAVLPPDDSRIGQEPMILSIVAPVVGVFEETANTATTKEPFESYQSLPTTLATPSAAPKSSLVTLTISPTTNTLIPIQNIHRLQTDLASFLTTACHKPVYTSLYHHAADAQPPALPQIPGSQHGGGEWVVFVLVAGDADAELVAAGLQGVQGQVEEWGKRARIEGSVQGLSVGTAVWRGDLFMA